MLALFLFRSGVLALLAALLFRPGVLALLALFLFRAGVLALLAPLLLSPGVLTLLALAVVPSFFPTASLAPLPALLLTGGVFAALLADRLLVAVLAGLHQFVLALRTPAVFDPGLLHRCSVALAHGAHPRIAGPRVGATIQLAVSRRSSS